MKRYMLLYSAWRVEPNSSENSVYVIQADSFREAANKLQDKYPNYSLNHICEDLWWTTPVKKFRRKFFHRAERHKVKSQLKNKSTHEELTCTEFLLRRTRSDLNFRKIRSYGRIYYD